MPKRMAALIEFYGRFVFYTWQIRETIAILLFFIVLGGWAIAKVESVELGDAIYFSFITGLSIGYGDIHPETVGGKIVSVVIGFVGMIFVGLNVAVATRALADTVTHFKKDPS
jgi:hypothetical protein